MLGLICYSFFVVDIWEVSSPHPDQSRSSSCLLGGSHPAPLCRLQVKAGFEEGWGIRWDEGFLTSGESSQSLRRHREVAGCLLENQGAGDGGISTAPCKGCQEKY